MITLMQFLALSGLDADVPTTKQSDSSRGACFKCFSTLTLNLKSLFLAQKFSGRLAPPWAQWLLYSLFFLGISFQKIRSCRARFKSSPCDSGKILKDYITYVTYFTQAVKNNTVGKPPQCNKSSFISLSAQSDSSCPDSVILFKQWSETRLFPLNWRGL